MKTVSHQPCEFNVWERGMKPGDNIIPLAYMRLVDHPACL